MEESLVANRAGGRVSCKKNCDGPQVDSSKRSQRHQCIGNSHTALRLDRGLAARTFTRVRHIVRHSRRRDLALAILYHIRWVNQSICLQARANESGSEKELKERYRKAVLRTGKHLRFRSVSKDRRGRNLAMEAAPVGPIETPLPRRENRVGWWSGEFGTAWVSITTGIRFADPKKEKREHAKA